MKHPRTVITEAGISGILMGIKLGMCGVSHDLIVEKGDRLGGN